MAPQEVVSTDRHIRLRYRDRQSGDDKSPVCADLLASPRLLYANGGKKNRARIIAQERLDIVRRPLRQRSYVRPPGSGAPGGLTTSRGLSPSVWNDASAIRSKNSPLRLGENFPSPSVQPN